MRKKEKRRPKTSITTEPAPARRAVPTLAAPAAAAPKPVEDTSWKTDPDLRAFACLLSFEVGWMTDPEAIVWRLDGKVIEVDRPQGHETVIAASRGALTMGAEATIAEIRRRWGDARAEGVEVFAFPDRAKPPAVQLLGDRAQYLRQLARDTWRSADGTAGRHDAAIEIIAASYVQLLRTVAARIQTANTGDQSASASQTRAVAVARVLDLINPRA